MKVSRHLVHVGVSVYPAGGKWLHWSILPAHNYWALSRLSAAHLKSVPANVLFAHVKLTVVAERWDLLQGESCTGLPAEHVPLSACSVWQSTSWGRRNHVTHLSTSEWRKEECDEPDLRSYSITPCKLTVATVSVVESVQIQSEQTHKMKTSG